jgi:hypothetical protein
MGAVLGFCNDAYIGYFSSEDIAVQEGCNRFEVVDDEYIGEDGVVFFVKLTIDTYFDDVFDIIVITHSGKENIEMMSQLISPDNLMDICKFYVEKLPEEDRAQLSDIVDPAEIICSVELMNGIAYPDEY